MVLKRYRSLLVVLSCLLQMNIAAAQTNTAEVRITKFTDHVYKFFVNDFVNVVAYVCADGVLLLDSGFDETADQIRARLSELGNDHIRYIINTHSDGDHTLGNSKLGETALIISHPLCRQQLQEDEEYPSEPLPHITVESTLRIYFGEEAIRVEAMPCHTNNDLVVYFENADILYVADIVFSNSFPVIHDQKGGDVDKMIEIIEQLQAAHHEDTAIVVGHGENIKIGDLAEYKHMIARTKQIVVNAMREGMTLEEMKERHILGEWVSWNSTMFEELNCEEWTETLFNFYRNEDN